MIEIRNLVKKYPGAAANAVDGLDLTIERGELFGLLGPNGAGKTTTISILSALLTPTSGTVRVAGFDVVKQANEVKRRIGVVPQDLAVYPALTARENLAFFGRLYRLSGATLRARVDEALERVGLCDRGDDRVDTYSGGMKRRVNIAAGLLHRPEVLLLDEPTVGVDPQSRNFILDGVAALAKEGLTVVYSTHYMEEVERLCSRIAILDHGRVLETDSPKALVARHGGEPVVEVKLPSLESVFLHLTGKRLRDQEA
ncbi:MAG TPA: ABC transporter ATP-binding protein [Thermoanaerobaculia bacterium]|jgi:ABC-2 type transport system ATP-binding protein|nr:ABC transporter ATP-binding protein [Thermoanaerobaculia bacterium]